MKTMIGLHRYNSRGEYINSVYSNQPALLKSKKDMQICED